MSIVFAVGLLNAQNVLAAGTTLYGIMPTKVTVGAAVKIAGVFAPTGNILNFKIVYSATETYTFQSEPINADLNSLGEGIALTYTIPKSIKTSDGKDAKLDCLNSLSSCGYYVTVTNSLGTTSSQPLTILALTPPSPSASVVNLINLPTPPKKDGSADASLAIRTALSQLPTTGGTLYIPAGTYRIDSQVNIDTPDASRNNITILGDGVGKTILMRGPSANSDFAVLVSYGKATRIAHLTFWGNSPTVVQKKKPELYLLGSNSILENTSIVGYSGYGVVSEGNSNIIRNNFLQSTGPVDNTTSPATVGMGIAFYCSKGNSYCKDPANRDLINNKIVIENNVVLSNVLNGIYVDSGTGIQINHNYLALNHRQTCSGGGGQIDAGGAQVGSNVSGNISNNIIDQSYGGLTSGIELHGSYQVTGNIIRNQPVQGIGLGSDAITAASSPSLLVSANYILNSGTEHRPWPGILVEGGIQNFAITKNSVSDSRPKKSQTYGVFFLNGGAALTGSLKGYSMTDNELRGSLFGGWKFVDANISKYGVLSGNTSNFAVSPAYQTPNPDKFEYCVTK